MSNHHYPPRKISLIFLICCSALFATSYKELEWPIYGSCLVIALVFMLLSLGLVCYSIKSSDVCVINIISFLLAFISFANIVGQVD